MQTSPESSPWNTLAIERTVIFAVHTVAAAMRLQDIAVLLENDPRIGLSYTSVPDRLGDGVDHILRKWEVRQAAWNEATNTSFDLAVGASLHQLGSLPARHRFAAPHGCGYNKRWPNWAWSGPDETRPTYGLDRESLLDDEGRPIVDALVLSHHDQLVTLARQCPQAAGLAVIGGDPAFDRLIASVPYRRLYRAALTVREGQTLVAVTSTWGQESLLSRNPDLLLRLLDELPANHRVMLTLHPAVWFEHGPGRIRTFLRDASNAGLDVIDAGEDWRGLLIAADFLIGDHTSVSVYGAARGLPFLLSHFAEGEIDPDSVMAELARCSPRLDDKRPLLDQLDAARQAQPVQQEVARERVSSVHGRSDRILRRALYRLLELDEPSDLPRVDRVRPPKLVGGDSGWW
jgi:hypothetical protein